MGQLLSAFHSRKRHSAKSVFFVPCNETDCEPQSPDFMAIQAPFSFQGWIDENRHLLKPPVGNQQVYKAAENFIVMVVGGPNGRKDYHVNETEEFFFMVEGDMVLKIIEDGEFKEIPIKQGEIFLLPPRVPHSPQRPADSVGLVMEVVRQDENLKDGFQWYCDNCGAKLHEEFEHISNIVEQLPPIMNRFWESEAARTCNNCGTVTQKP